jgi:nucleotide-binding universal stress UspA family protein
MKQIIVGVDGSENSKRALAWALEEARLRGTGVCLLHAWHQVYSSGYPLVPVAYEPEIYEKAAQELMAEMLEAVGAATAEVAVETKIVQGGAATALINAGHDAELLVVGARGTGGFLGLVLGSVATQVTSHAPCPVVVVPHDS